MYYRKLDEDDVRECAQCTEPVFRAEVIRSAQITVYVMCGGGMLGRQAAQQPADFSIDDRVSRMPYSRRAILQAVMVLRLMAEAHGLNAHDMPKMPLMHEAGIF